MAEQKSTLTTPLFDNIRSQPDALQQVLAQQLGDGRAALSEAAKLIGTRPKVVLTGMGASLFACGPLRYSLSQHGRVVSVVETAELLYFLNGILDGDTTVVLVSRSGESIEVIRLLEMMQQRGCLTVGVSNVPGSTLTQRTDVSILLGSPADQLVAVQTYVATVAVLQLLGAECSHRLDDSSSQLAQAIRLLESFVPACVKASTKWQDFLNTSPLYILSRGRSLATVEEGVLLMHETAKFPTVGMSVAQFRHGPVEVAGPRVRAVIIAADAATAHHDEQMALDLTRMGVDVRWIGPGSPAQTFAPWPEDMPLEFQPLFEVVPLQLLAYRTAELRGITPGAFRWAPHITSSESGFPALPS